ncbi:hypothetical protein CMV_015954 [Castanea mollissima]|uniref:Uncharacterized protein n=1 Tax=Castanea mollissima TaxID=60419 RepID=A0A8J4VJN6_9ROSI|nr:hypothetical protein CMV_015954 [Castanea mollissima]
MDIVNSHFLIIYPNLRITTITPSNFSIILARFQSVERKSFDVGFMDYFAVMYIWRLRWVLIVKWSKLLRIERWRITYHLGATALQTLFSSLESNPQVLANLIGAWRIKLLRVAS